MFVRKIQSIVVKVLEKYGLLTHEWHLGKVSSVNANGTLNVYIDGSTTATPSIPSNPQLVFNTGDYVWVQFINRSPNNLFVPSKRYVEGVQYNTGELYAPINHNHDGVYSLDGHNHDNAYVPKHWNLYGEIIVSHNVAGYSANSSASAGAFVIKTKEPFLDATMQTLEIDGYFYDGTGAYKSTIGFYNYSTGQIYNHGYVNLGNKDLAVRVGKDPNGYLVIILGDETAGYAYPKLVVSKYIQGYARTSITNAEGWTITQESDLSAYTDIQSIAKKAIT
jgi:hypothetical protein